MTWACTSGRGCSSARALRRALKTPRAQALTSVKKTYGNLVMRYVDNVVIATPILPDHIDGLEKVFECMKIAGLKCKPSEWGSFGTR